MSFILNLRKLVVCLLMCSLLLSGLLTLTTRQSHASNNSLPYSLTETVNESPEKSVPQAKAIDEAMGARVSEAYSKLPLSFEENRGQADNEVKYISRGAGYTLFLAPTEAVLALRRSDDKRATSTAANARHSGLAQQPHHMRASVLRMKLGGANPSPHFAGESAMGVKTNYFKGNDPKKWQTGISRYERVRYAQVYPGIDMVYYGEQQQLEYDFEVAPGADSQQVALEFTGVKQVKVERGTGDLVIKIAGGEVRQHRPVTYQEVGGKRREVASRYVMQGKGKVGIKVGEYDRTQRLVIDPVLSYSTYLGGNDLGYGFDFGQAIAVDAAGIAYVAGWTYSAQFPTLNQYQTYQGDSDVFVTKLDTNASGNASLLYSTYLGGKGFDLGSAIAIDAAGNAYVTGWTWSSDFPTKNQYQLRQGTDVSDVFVLKLNTNSSGAASLLYSTYLGGTNYDTGNGIAIDASGNIYVTGYTRSTRFPTFHEYEKNQGGDDAIVVKLNPNLSGAASLLYSTYLGGGSADYGQAIALDSAGKVYVTGQQDGGSVFVAKLDTNASGAASLLQTTYLGSGFGEAIAIDSSDNVYVTGYTYSFGISTLNEYQTFQGGDYDAFVTKFNPNLPDGASLLYSTYLGGRNADYGTGIAVDSAGIAYVTGATESANFPTKNQYQTYQGDSDVFVAKLDTNASGDASLLYSTYLGGRRLDQGFGIAIDAAGNAYVTGRTESTNFPTKNQYQTHQVGQDAFVTKLTDTYSISGRVTNDGTKGIGGVTVKLSGSQSGTMLTDSTGSYSFTNLQRAGNYTVTPTRSGLTFIPPEQSFNDLRADQMNINFIPEPATISGQVKRGSVGLSGVTITLTGGAGFTPRTVLTASNGTYTFTGVPVPGNYRITPSKTSYTFSPTQLILNQVTDDQTDQSFIATFQSYTIGGVVKLGVAGLPGVTVKLVSPAPAGFTTRATTTDSAGAYSFSNVPAGRDYIVTPTKAGYQFMPTSRPLTNLSADQTTVNFLVKVYSITGRITRTGTTTGIGAVTVRLTSPTPAGFPTRMVQTSSTGTYTFTTLPAGRNYTIKPTKTGFTFSPTTQSITNLSGNVPAGASTNFTGTGP